MKRVISLVAAAALLLTLVACGSFERVLHLEGDAEAYAFTARRYERPIELAPVFAGDIETRAETFDLLLIGADGLVSRISGDDLSGCALVYSREYAWEFRSEAHPPSANIKNLTSIVVVSTAEDPRAVRFISGDEVRAITAGQLRLREERRVLREEGASYHNNRGVTVYTTQRRAPLSDILPEGDFFCAMGFSGEAMFFRGLEGCYLMNDRNAVSLHLPDGRMLRGLAGVMADPPGFLITETYRDALRFLEQGERVMVFNLDGFGWDMLGYAPYVGSLAPRRALACYPPISPVGLAAMVTGVTPDQNGVQDRENREPARGDIFAAAGKLGKTSVHIGGGQSVINTSEKPELALGDADACMLVKQALKNPPDLLFVHFHGIDETAHAFGPHAEETRRYIAEIDGYVRSLAESFDGRVIIVADHGLHPTQDGGNHGVFLPEDMVVPYVVRQ